MKRSAVPSTAGNPTSGSPAQNKKSRIDGSRVQEARD